jgi:hypothetical protein
MEKIHYGEINCEKDNCSNKAHWYLDQNYLCGVHARKNTDREALPKFSKKETQERLTEKITKDKKLIGRARRKNADAGRRGRIILCRMWMYRNPENKSGFLKVYPNFKHQNKKDGFGCMRLSPTALGPVHHGQPGLPPAKNIENFHRGNKVFAEEMDEDGNPSKEYYENRECFYLDDKPHRHKFVGAGKNKNIPKYFIWVDKDGFERRLTYIESRQFYCTFYERLASQEKDFKRLLQLYRKGFNLQICGYDAHPMSIDQIQEEYLNPEIPFGHERVLVSMLLLWDTPGEFPWRKHQTFEILSDP